MADNKYAMNSIIKKLTPDKMENIIEKINKALEKRNNQASWSNINTTTTTTAAPSTFTTPIAAAPIVEGRKQKAKREEQTAKILGDDSIYSNITDKYHNKQDFVKTQKEEQKNTRNWNSLFLWNSNYTEEEQAAKDKLRAENTAKYRDEMMGKQYDKDVEKWGKFVQSSEDVDQDLIDYINWIQWSLEWTWFNKIKRERLRDWLQWLINTLIYEDDNKYTTDFLKNTSDYVAGWVHASASDNKINEALQAIQTLKEMRDIILKEKLGWKEDNDLYL